MTCEDGCTCDVPPGIGLTAEYVLALLEHLGYISREQAEALIETANAVFPLTFDSTVSVVNDTMRQLPVWDSCPVCRLRVSQFKNAVVQWHGAGHPDPEQATVTE